MMCCLYKHLSSKMLVSMQMWQVILLFVSVLLRCHQIPILHLLFPPKTFLLFFFFFTNFGAVRNWWHITCNFREQIRVKWKVKNQRHNDCWWGEEGIRKPLGNPKNRSSSCPWLSWLLACLLWTFVRFACLGALHLSTIHSRLILILPWGWVPLPRHCPDGAAQMTEGSTPSQAMPTKGKGPWKLLQRLKTTSSFSLVVQRDCPITSCFLESHSCSVFYSFKDWSLYFFKSMSPPTLF